MIPKIIHQFCHDTSNVPSLLLEASEVTKKSNHDFKYFFHDDQSALEAIQNFFGNEYSNIYQRNKIPASRCDLARLVFLFVYGGFYVDLSYRIKYSLSAFQNEDLVLVKRDDFDRYKGKPEEAHFTNSVIGAPKQSKFIESCVHEAFSRLKSGRYNFDVINATGPGVINYMLGLKRDVCVKSIYFSQSISDLFDYVRVNDFSNGWTKMQKSGILEESNKKVLGSLQEGKRKVLGDNCNFPIIFPHIPKTAGTSLRKSFEAYFGDSYIAKDFGPAFQQTTPCVKHLFFEKNDPYELKNKLDKDEFCVLTGHFESSRYIQLYPVSQFVTFLRDPVKRVFSEYRHRATRNFDRFEGSLEEFCDQEKSQNLQFSMLHGCAWPAFAFVGVTEKFDTSLSILNEELGLSLESVEANKFSKDKSFERELTLSERDYIKNKNGKDVALYSEVCAYLDEREKFSSEKFVKGQLEVIKENCVIGYAIPPALDSLSPVAINVYVNDRLVGTVMAKEYRKYLHLLGVKRNGHVGFRLKLKNLNKGDKIVAKVAKTGQKLAYTLKA